MKVNFEHKMKTQDSTPPQTHTEVLYGSGVGWDVVYIIYGFLEPIFCLLFNIIIFKI